MIVRTSFRFSCGTYPGGYRSTECSILLCLAIPMPVHYRIYLPVMLSRLAFSIMAPKSTLECGGAGRGDTDMGLEATVIFVCWF